MDKNFAWLTQKIEYPKSNKGNLTPPHTVWLNCKVIKKGDPLPPNFCITPPVQVYSPFLAKNFVPLPQVTQFSEGPLICFLIIARLQPLQINFKVRKYSLRSSYQQEFLNSPSSVSAMRLKSSVLLLLSFSIFANFL